MNRADAGFLAHPIPFDVGPDGRIYVLDAGNSRIVVFDETGAYITRRGRRGSGPGEFDFGDGNRLIKGLAFFGSIAVDDDGAICVADAGNGRIQKFDP